MKGLGGERRGEGWGLDGTEGFVGPKQVFIYYDFGQDLRINKPRFEGLADFASVVISVNDNVRATPQGRNSEPDQSQVDPPQANLVVKIQSFFFLVAWKLSVCNPLLTSHCGGYMDL